MRQIAVDALKELGYSVLEAPNGPAALEMLSRSRRVDLLFTDFAMPGGLNGRDLAVEAQSRRPEIKVLLTSAYTDRLFAEAGRSCRCGSSPSPIASANSRRPSAACSTAPD